MRIKIMLLGLVLVVCMIVLVPYRDVIAFEYESSGNILAYLPLDTEHTTFTLLFTHSIHLTDVLETYRIDEKNRIHQTEISFEEFGIGMPSGASGQEEFHEEDGVYYIKNMDRVFPFIDIRIAKIYPKHIFTYKDEQYSLPQIIGSGTWVRLKGKKVNIWQQLKGVNMIEQ